MKKTLIIFIIFIFLVPFLFLITVSLSNGQYKSFLYTKIYSDKEEITHFTEVYIDLYPYGFKDMYSSIPIEAKTIKIFRAPPEFAMEWHPAPSKQFIMVLSGAMEVESGDGEKRQFQTGNVLLAEDTTGQGHKTRTVGKKELVCAWIKINE